MELIIILIIMLVFFGFIYLFRDLFSTILSIVFWIGIIGFVLNLIVSGIGLIFSGPGLLLIGVVIFILIKVGK